MSKKQEGLFQTVLDKIFEENKVTANEIGMDKALILADQQLKIFQLIEDAKADFHSTFTLTTMLVAKIIIASTSLMGSN